jgi:hypothetical protein
MVAEGREPDATAPTLCVIIRASRGARLGFSVIYTQTADRFAVG